MVTKENICFRKLSGTTLEWGSEKKILQRYLQFTCDTQIACKKIYMPPKLAIMTTIYLKFYKNGG